MTTLTILSFMARIMTNHYIQGLALITIALFALLFIWIAFFRPKEDYNSYNHFS